MQCRAECKIGNLYATDLYIIIHNSVIHIDLFCTLIVLCNDTDIRLAGGSDQYEGRVEICYNETWGTICDGSWSTNDANVACRQLGYAATGIHIVCMTFN